MMHPRRMRNPWAQWNGLFNEDEVKSIIEIGESLEKQEGKTGDLEGEVSEMRKSIVSWIYRNDKTSWIFDRIDGAIFNLNSSFFGLNIEKVDSLQYTIYESNEETPESFYDWHWDMRTGENLEIPAVDQQRKVSASILLSNPDDYEGGDLELSTCGRLSVVERQLGHLTAFPSFVTHRVSPVTKGKRISLVAWYEGPDWA